LYRCYLKNPIFVQAMNPDQKATHIDINCQFAGRILSDFRRAILALKWVTALYTK